MKYFLSVRILNWYDELLRKTAELHPLGMFNYIYKISQYVLIDDNIETKKK